MAHDLAPLPRCPAARFGRRHVLDAAADRQADRPRLQDCSPRIAAAKIHRLRNELLLHRGHEDWARTNLNVGMLGGDAERYPRAPVVLGEKWDY
ncbi:hypothetical protein [Bradyrhizobium pachyrhizi]|uniref:hypothetical protein n=1 Tax=Bradyrhizobium pachyrhizi TaxID=280333 RepID=UPI00128F1AB5|nr:hypothetical protein [Bradyrhizobium pachyrhizi]